MVRVAYSLTPRKPDLHKRWTVCEKSEGKRALSVFSLIRYDSLTQTSLLRCAPVTGRTHQLRVHLMSIGFPIKDDPLYATPYAARDVITNDDPLHDNAQSNGDVTNTVEKEDKIGSLNGSLSTPRDDVTQQQQEEQQEEQRDVETLREDALLELCVCCTQGEQAAFSSDQLRSTGIYLHAHRCDFLNAEGDQIELTLKVPPPCWATPLLGYPPVRPPSTEGIF
uniref:Pseudouridine synthase RsuA/RluA-like domain-containing protein n=1 Tax=Octactis speculum TaxID=3111310 RepID=A0A7S2BPR6_9STRA